MLARRSSFTRVLGCVGLLLLAACAAHTTRGGDGTPAARPAVVTVQRLKTLLLEGETTPALMAEIDQSGTVYRLTTEQRESLRADGMPPALLSRMQETYEGALRAHPDLAKSNDQWLKIGDYSYGGLPAGWPREWLQH
jgi:hypothetical protein